MSRLCSSRRLQQYRASLRSQRRLLDRGSLLTGAAMRSIRCIRSLGGLDTRVNARLARRQVWHGRARAFSYDKTPMSARAGLTEWSRSSISVESQQNLDQDNLGQHDTVQQHARQADDQPPVGPTGSTSVPRQEVSLKELLAILSGDGLLLCGDALLQIHESLLASATSLPESEAKPASVDMQTKPESVLSPAAASPPSWAAHLEPPTQPAIAVTPVSAESALVFSLPSHDAADVVATRTNQPVESLGQDDVEIPESLSPATASAAALSAGINGLAGLDQTAASTGVPIEIAAISEVAASEVAASESTTSEVTTSEATTSHVTAMEGGLVEPVGRDWLTQPLLVEPSLGPELSTEASIPEAITPASVTPEAITTVAITPEAITAAELQRRARVPRLPAYESPVFTFARLARLLLGQPASQTLDASRSDEVLGGELSIRCPTCNATQPPSPECRRCKCDLTWYSTLVVDRERMRRTILQRLRAGDYTDAALQAWILLQLSPDPDTLRLVAISQLLAGDQATAMALIQSQGLTQPT